MLVGLLIGYRTLWRAAADRRRLFSPRKTAETRGACRPGFVAKKLKKTCLRIPYLWLEDVQNEELRADATLIHDQADRCRDILRSMGQAGKDDLHLRRAPFAAVIREAAEPHSDRGIELHYDIAASNQETELRQPIIERRPEIIHGVRNLVQNAVDFADENVWIDAAWTDEKIIVKVSDDGPGYPSHLIGRIGDPFMTHRGWRPEKRPEYEGMGLGLFIAKTLLERSGAERLKMGFSMFDTARALMRAGLGEEIGTGRSPELLVRLFERTYGSDFDPETAARIIAHLRAP